MMHGQPSIKITDIFDVKTLVHFMILPH